MSANGAGGGGADGPLHFRRVGDGVVVVRPHVSPDTGSLHFFRQVATCNLATGDIRPSRDHPPSEADVASIEAFIAEARRRRAEAELASAFTLLETMERVRRLLWDGAFEDDPVLREALLTACLDLRDTLARRPRREERDGAAA